MHFDPFREIDTLQNTIFNDDWMMPMKNISFPTTDIYTSKNNELMVEAHLPNFTDGDIDIRVDDGALIIQAEKHEREEDKDRKYVVRESSSSFYRRIQLPEYANTDKIDAHLDNGILKVMIPLVKLPEPKKIVISSKSKK